MSYCYSKLSFPVESTMRVKNWHQVYDTTDGPPPAVVSFTDGWFPRIAGRTAVEIVGDLTKSWSPFRTPYLREFAIEILDRELAGFSFDTRGQQWLTFDKPGAASLHLAPPQRLPTAIRNQFPFERIDGLVEFIEHFGGLVEGHVPPGAHFWSAGECRVVANHCPKYDWGLIGDWAGALPIYTTGTGNILVISPDNRVAKWDHDIGWENEVEDPFEPLHWSMAEMVEAFLEYISIADHTSETVPVAVKESPFYY